MKIINCFLTEHRTTKMPFELSDSDYNDVINENKNLATIKGFIDQACNCLDDTDHIDFTYAIENPDCKTPIHIPKLKILTTEIRQFLDTANWPEDSDEENFNKPLQEMLETMQSAWEEGTTILEQYENS